MEGSTDNIQAFFEAAGAGDSETVKNLLARYAIHVNVQQEDGLTVLHWAVRKGQTKIVKLLLAQKAIELNIKTNFGKTPLHDAVQKKWLDIIEILVADKRTAINAVDWKNRTPLYYASRKGWVEIAKLLLRQAEIAVDTKDSVGHAPLLVAASQGGVEIVKLLIEHQANINEQQEDGLASLHLAIQKGHTEIVEYLLEREGIQLNIKTKSGKTPLHSAARAGYTDIIRLLAAKPGVDLNAKDQYGWTPLMDAAFMSPLNPIDPQDAMGFQKHIESVKALLVHGADVDTASCSELPKEKFWGWFIRMHNGSVINCLMSAGFDTDYLSYIDNPIVKEQVMQHIAQLSERYNACYGSFFKSDEVTMTQVLRAYPYIFRKLKATEEKALEKIRNLEPKWLHDYIAKHNSPIEIVYEVIDKWGRAESIEALAERLSLSVEVIRVIYDGLRNHCPETHNFKNTQFKESEPSSGPTP